jgi:2-iminobutanoate/2-iminopropanoate deaminase
MVEPVSSDAAPPPVGPYSQAVRVRPGEVLFSAGQIPIDPSSGEICSGGIEEQTRRVLENLRAVLEAGGFTLGDVVKTTVFMSNLGEFSSMNGVYSEYFSEPYPARSCFEASALPKGALVEIDVIAVKEHG